MVIQKPVKPNKKDILDTLTSLMKQSLNTDDVKTAMVLDYTMKFIEDFYDMKEKLEDDWK